MKASTNRFEVSLPAWDRNRFQIWCWKNYQLLGWHEATIQHIQPFGALIDLQGFVFVLPLCFHEHVNIPGWRDQKMKPYIQSFQVSWGAPPCRWTGWVAAMKLAKTFHWQTFSRPNWQSATSSSLRRTVLWYPNAPCREYLPTFPLECSHFSPNVGKSSIHSEHLG